MGRIARGIQRGSRAILARFRSQRRKTYDLVVSSGLFDADYYLSRAADPEGEQADPLRHFLERGWRQGRNPNAYFDTCWYLEKYPEVAAAGINPLVDYLQSGWTCGRDPSVRFETLWYLERFPDVSKAGVNPLCHFLKWGEAEGRSPKNPASSNARLDPYEAWLSVNEHSQRDIEELREELERKAAKLPKISVITPVYNTPAWLLEEAVASVARQVHEDWELCLVDDASTSEHIGPLLRRMAEADGRVRIRHLPVGGGISAATNAGVEIATGDVILFLDHDDLLTPDCLAEIALHYADNPDADIVYSDDDKIDSTGRRFAPQFKPDWAPTLLLSWMYLGHAFSVRRRLFQELGGFRADFDGAQDHDFALRATEVARGVGHVHRILYHWRAIEGSTAIGGGAKPESMERGCRAVQEALDRRGIVEARAVHPAWAKDAQVGMYGIEFPDHGPTVAIVIAVRDSDSLRKCLNSLRKTSYQNYEILVIDGGSLEAGSVDPAEARVIAGFAKTSTPASLRNEAARLAGSDYLLFLEPDAEVINADWLSQLVGYAQMEGVGVVGAQLISAEGKIEHSGKIHGLHEGLVGDAFRGLPSQAPGYLGFATNAREYSAVSGACLMTSSELFAELGGFDEDRFPVAYGDVDYCYRAAESGHRCICCPAARLKFLPKYRAQTSQALTERRNYRLLHGDWRERFYNSNLSLENELFTIEAVRPETRSGAPIRLLAVTHNLNHEGAPRTLADLMIGLSKRGIDPVVISPSDGPLRDDYEAAGIEVRIIESVRAADCLSNPAMLRTIASLVRGVNADVILANTLQSVWAITVASLIGTPSILAQHESEPWESYFDYLPVEARSRAYQAFSDTYRVVYVAQATRRAWQPLETRRNFKVIRHGIPAGLIAEETGRWTRSAARKCLGLPDHVQVISVVGTLCRRKGQLDLVQAYAKLAPEVRSSTYVFIVGKIGEQDYASEVSAAIGEQGQNIRVTDAVEDPFLYYSASDVFACTSRFESAPRIIIEAMACGLPIVTTPVFGIPEIVCENLNALFYKPGDTAGLAKALTVLLQDHDLRKRLSLNSVKVLDSEPGFDQMVEAYARIIRQAVNLKVASPGSGSVVCPG